MARMMPAIEFLGENSEIESLQLALVLMPAPKHETASDCREVDGDHVWLE
jgi:hypothetical protein